MAIDPINNISSKWLYHLKNDNITLNSLNTHYSNDSVNHWSNDLISVINVPNSLIIFHYEF